MKPPRDLNVDAPRQKTSPSRTAAARSCAASTSTSSSGEVVGLLGPNGAGKTTTFYMTVGLTSPDRGRVFLDGEDVTDDPMYVRARKGIGYLPQEPSIFRGLTVEQNILAILETLDLDWRRTPRARLKELLAELNLTPLASAPALHALGRRAAARRDHARAGHVAALHPARRALRGHRSDRGDRHSEDHFSPEGARHRRARSPITTCAKRCASPTAPTSSPTA